MDTLAQVKTLETRWQELQAALDNNPHKARTAWYADRVAELANVIRQWERVTGKQG